MGKTRPVPDEADRSGDGLLDLLRTLSDNGELPVDAGGDGSADSPTVARRKTEILEAALQVFATKGFDGSRTKEIAREAKVSEATVFKYFPSKKSLLFSLIRPIFDTVARPLFLQPLQERIQGESHRPLADILYMVMADRYEQFSRNSRLATTAVMEMLRNPDVMEFAKQVIFPEILRTLQPIFETAMARGEIRQDLDPRVLCRCFISQIVGYIVMVTHLPDTFARSDWRADIHQTVQLFVHGLKTPQEVPHVPG
jgi:AcrR family transcriptional regulator